MEDLIDWPDNVLGGLLRKGDFVTCNRDLLRTFIPNWSEQSDTLHMGFQANGEADINSCRIKRLGNSPSPFFSQKMFKIPKNIQRYVDGKYKISVCGTKINWLIFHYFFLRFDTSSFSIMCGITLWAATTSIFVDGWKSGWARTNTRVSFPIDTSRRV